MEDPHGTLQEKENTDSILTIVGDNTGSLQDALSLKGTGALHTLAMELIGQAPVWGFCDDAGAQPDWGLTDDAGAQPVWGLCDDAGAQPDWGLTDDAGAWP